MQKAEKIQKFWSRRHYIFFFSNRACKFVSILLKLEASNLPTLEELYVGKYNGVMEILTFFNYFNQSPYNRPAES